MHSLIKVWVARASACSLGFSRGLLFLALAHASPTLSFHVMGDDTGSWPAILSSIGLTENSTGDVLVLAHGAQLSVQECQSRLDRGAILILEGPSPLAESFGFHATSKPHVIVRSVEDVRASKLHIVWEQPLDLPVFEIPKEARLFAAERWQGTPLMAGFKRAKGAVLWIAASPGPHGYERFPYIPQALADLGLEAPFRSERYGLFSIPPTARVSTSITSPRVGRPPASARCTWPRGTTGNATRRATNTCAN